MNAPSEDKRPRFFWRRLFAFLIDYLLVSLLATALLLPFLAPETGALRLSGFLTTYKCAPMTSVTEEIAERVAVERISAVKLCQHWENGIANGRTVTLNYDKTETKKGAVTYRSEKNLTLSLDGHGKIIQTISPQNMLQVLLLIVIGGFLLGRGKQSPGKRLLGLRISGTGCALCREFRRFAPFLVLFVAELCLSAMPFGTLDKLLALGVGPIIAVGALLFCVLFAYYVWPMLRWRGAMPYDRATGFLVERA